jgi:hypothetical protein
MAGALLVTAVNEWPQTLGGFTTQLSFGNQAGIALLGLGLGLAVLAMALGLMAGLGHTWIQDRPPSVANPGVVGLAMGTAYVGLSMLLSRLSSGGPDDWPGFGGAVSYLPSLSTGLGAVVGFLTATTAVLLVIASLERLRGTRWSWTGIPLVLIPGLVMTPNPPGASWLAWIGGALGIAAGFGILWAMCRRLGWAILPGVVAAPVLLGVVETALRHPFPGNTLGAAFALAAVATSARFWTRSL